MLLNKWIVLIVLCFNALNCMDYQSKTITKILPVNHLLEPGNKLSLRVQVPNTFKPVGDPYQAFSEFIPRTDNNVNKWSQIITICTMVGNKINASNKENTDCPVCIMSQRN